MLFRSPFEVEVRDDDAIGSDPCGLTHIALDKLKAAPNTWAVNEILPLKNGDKLQGSIYIQVKFIPDGATDDGKPAQTLEHKGPEDPASVQKPAQADKSEEELKKTGIVGQLKIVVKSARDLPNKDGFGQGVSDPLATVKLPDGQKWQTKVVKDNLNPDWNETKVFKVRLNKEVAAR